MSKDYPKPVENGELREQLAAIEHERWADWQKWCHKVLRENNPSPEQGDILERWDRQIETPYAELSEAEKQSDRDQVDRYWQSVEAYLAQEKAKTAKAYGGCTNCYGKGYATHIDATTAYADFGDEFGGAQFVKTTSQEMLFCKCERGQALAKLLDKENV